jgi:hypothetical protein
MGTKAFQLFIRLPEFLYIINPIIESLKLEPILQRLRNNPVQFMPTEQPVTVEKIESTNSDRMYLAITKTAVESLDPRNFRPAQLGWIKIDFPREKNTILLMTDIGIKTDWYEDDIRYENKELMKICNKFISRLKRKLNFPVRSYNINYPETINIRSDIGYGQSAKDFFQHGGELMQDGVNNGRFIIGDIKNGNPMDI